MIGPFPWQPFPPDEPGPGGVDPIAASIYRGAVEGADAYRAVRAALRRDGGVLRVGNRFVPEGRYREVAFLALGHAASSMALAALHTFGERLTQGFLAGPEEPPASVPFRSVTIDDGWGGAAAAPQVVDAAREIPGELHENDLLLVLLSPGAVRAVLLPPAGSSSTEFASLLERLYAAGATGAEVGEVARVFGGGGVGGRLLPASVAADVQVLLVDRGDGPVAVGGGPTYPVTDDERARAQATVARAGLTAAFPPPEARAGALPLAGAVSRTSHRPVVVAAPEDALRGAADAAVDKGWSARMGVLGLRERPQAAAGTFLARAESVFATERPEDGGRSKGIAVFATTTLDLPEGVVERPACEAFLATALGALRRREASVGLLRTAGPTGPPPSFAGGVVGAPGDPNANVPPGAARRLAMRAGIADVGMLAVALVPTVPRARGARRA